MEFSRSDCTVALLDGLGYASVVAVNFVLYTSGMLECNSFGLSAAGAAAVIISPGMQMQRCGLCDLRPLRQSVVCTPRSCCAMANQALHSKLQFGSDEQA